MPIIEGAISKTIRLTNVITIDGVRVKGQTAEINSTNEITFSEWTDNMDMYKANRTDVRKLENDFEDQAFAEQDKLLAEVAEGKISE